MLRARRKPLPTDLEILNRIYDAYYDEFAAGARDSPPPGATIEQLRQSKVYVPLDIAALARQLHVDADIVFGRLYYHLDHRHRYTQQDSKATVHLFTRKVGETVDCVNFPYLASVLADLRDQARRHRHSTVIAWVSVVVSAIAIMASAWVTITVSRP